MSARWEWLANRIGAVMLLTSALTTGCRVVEAQARLVAAEAQPASFARVEGPQPFDFPADHGPHPDYQTEWWYFTGNLDTPDGRHFGYQLTFFRRALEPAGDRAGRASAWATEQVYMAHLTLTDVAGRDFYAAERLERGAAGLAGAQAEPFRVWLDDWSAEAVERGVYRLRAAQDGLAFDLTLRETKGPVLQGDQGYSQKGPEAGNASAYVSLTRLETSGMVSIRGEEMAASGLSWMDHEYGTSALAAGQVGWDWFSLQLDDGSELMLYTIRRTDGSRDPFSKGTVIARDGVVTPLSYAQGDFGIDVLGTWRSPHNGATYPARWRVVVPSEGLDLAIEPWLADQELNVSYAYWEGAVRVTGERDGQPVRGNGYVELTGYAASMEGQF